MYNHTVLFVSKVGDDIVRPITTWSIAGLLLFSSSLVLANDKEGEIDAIASSVVTIAQAIRKLEKRYRAVAVEVEVESWRDIFVYEVELIDGEGERKIEIKLDMTSGEVLKEGITSIASWFGVEDKRQAAADAVTKNGFGIHEAIVVAEKYVTGHIYEAELEREKGITYVKIKFYTANGKEKAIVDVETQSIIPVLKRR